jgi:plasmid stabilization system protein ParE
MTRRVEWSIEASRDFEEAMEHIAFDSEAASTLIATRILTAVDRLGDMPTGHPGRVKGTYEKLVQKTPYIIAYTLSDATVGIARIVHGARDWPEGEWPAE